MGASHPGDTGGVWEGNAGERRAGYKGETPPGMGEASRLTPVLACWLNRYGFPFQLYVHVLNDVGENDCVHIHAVLFGKGCFAILSDIVH